MSVFINNIPASSNTSADYFSPQQARNGALLARSARHFHEQALVGIYMVDAAGCVLYANPKMAAILGYGNAGEMVGLPFSELVAPEDLARVQAHHQQLLEGVRGHVGHTFRMSAQDGNRRWMEVHGSMDEFDGRTVLLGMALDVNQQVEAAWHSRLADRVFESASEGILITDEECRILTVNPAFTRITGYSIDEAIGKHSRMMTGPSSRTNVNRSMLEQLAAIGNWQGEMMDRRKDGTWYPAWLSISTVRGSHDAISHYVGVFTDNTSRKEAENKLAYLAEHDSLTGLFNRNSLMRVLSEKIAGAEQYGQHLVLLFIDFDRFKSVNDTLGHHSGDQLLVAATERLRRQLRQQDVLARFGGDEFIVVLDESPSEEMVTALAQRLMGDMTEPFFINGHKIFLSASIGCAMYPQHGKDAVTILKNADIAMYRAKERGKNAFQLFNKEMSDHALEQMQLENSLRHALERQEFELFYQPQVCAGDGSLCGMEALVRWRHPTRGLIAPGLFISLAEQTGLIVPLGDWILREACRQGKAWADRGYRFGRIAVNLSPCQFLSDDLAAAIDAALAQSGLPPSMLELEITESAIMQNQQAATALLKRMRELGVAISVDDFGTGYSSLASLKQYPLDTLKIDRSFVKDIPHDADNVAITEAIIAIAHKLRLQVVAEGVESEDQHAFLRSAGCDIIQGYLHGRPLAPADIESRWLAGES